MSDYDDNNKGVIFLEQDKKTEKSPDYTGKLNVEGAEFRIAGWKRVSKNGKPFISLAVSDPEEYKPKNDEWEKAREKFSKPETDEEEPINIDDIPF